MMKLNRLMAAVLVAGATQVAAAAPTQLIDFDGNVQSNTSHGIFERGYRFYNDQSLTFVWQNDGPPGGASNGTPHLIAYRYGLNIERRDGQAFTLLGMDMGLNWSSVPDATIEARLTHADGSVSMQSIEVGTPFRTLSFADEVRKVQFSGLWDSYLALDNVVVSGPVPEPSSLALWAFGAAGLAAALRRRRRSAG